MEKMASFIRRNFMKCATKSKSFKARLSPAILKVYVSIFTLMFSSSFTITVLFPFLPFMIKFLVKDVDEVGVGNYLGVVPTAMFVGRFFGSYVWGAIADQVGRKPVLVVSTLLVGLSALGFGFSVTFPMAVALRFLVGLFNGIPGTAKAMLSESSTDKSQALGMAVFSSAWGLGLIAGSSIGGLLAVSDPLIATVAFNSSAVGNASGTISSPGFFDKFPYSPPCMVNAGVCLVAAFLALFLLPETLASKKNKKSKELRVKESVELEPMLPSEESLSDSDNDSLEVVVHTNEAYGVPERIDSGDGSEDNSLVFPTNDLQDTPTLTRPVLKSLDRSSNSYTLETMPGLSAATSSEVAKTSEFTLSKPCCQLQLDDHNHVGSSNDAVKIRSGGSLEAVDSANVVDSPVEVEPPVSSPPHGPSGGLHVLPWSIDRRNSAHFGYFSGSVEHLVDQGSRRRRFSNMLRRQSVSLSSKLGHDDCCVSCCASCPKLQHWSRKLVKGLKSFLRNMYIFMRDPTSRKAIIIYSVISIAIIGFDEMYSIFCKTSPSLGGLGLTQSEIGWSLTIVGALMLPILFFLFPLLERKLGSKKSFQYMCILAMVGTLLMPTLNAAARQGNTVVLWTFLVLLMTVIRCGVGVGVAAGSLFVNNSVHFHQLASINGFSMTVTSLTRMLTPVVLGPIWSASLSETFKNIGFPFDYHLIFIICGLVYFACVIVASLLPKTIDQQKKLVQTPEQSEVAEDRVELQFVSENKNHQVFDEHNRSNGESLSSFENSHRKLLTDDDDSDDDDDLMMEHPV